MSHFTLLVVGARDEAEVERKLDPFWELDLTLEAASTDYRSDFATEFTKEGAIQEFQEFISKAPTKEQIEYAHSNLLKNIKEEFSSTIEPFNKEEWEKWLKNNNLDSVYVKQKMDKDYYRNYEEYIKRYYGYKYNDSFEAFGYFYNPNAKWDWYQIGGRWSGFWTLKEGKEGIQGEKSWAIVDNDIPSNECDIAKIKDIDFEAMSKKSQIRAEKNWNSCWEEYPLEYDEEGKDKNSIRKLIYGIDPDNSLEAKQKYIENSKICSTFAVLKDGEWYEKGEVGWWGMVSNEKDQAEWDKEFEKLLKSFDPETYVAVVDCHI